MFIFAAGVALQAQPAVTACVPSAMPPLIRFEGITERVGDIVFNCSGVPNSSITGNLTITLNANVTNRISTSNTYTGLVFTIDSGTGPQAVTVPPMVFSQNGIVYNGVTIRFSPAGTAVLDFSGIRVNATQLALNASVFAFLGINGSTLLPLNTSQVTVGTPRRAIFAGFSSKLICSPRGAALPDTINFASLITSGAFFTSTRVTEGFADSFQPRSGWPNFNADTGERIIVRYSGFPQGARLFVPDVVAGSNAVQPTAGGDFGLPASGGAFAPSTGGSLLLARVAGADANGAGGFVVFAPGAVGSGTVAFNNVSELQIANGNAFAVYEVVDSDPHVIESAQFPTFLGLPPAATNTVITTGEDVFFAPLSTVTTASSTDPLPRLAAMPTQPDCTIVGDCTASFMPQLQVDTTPLQFTAAAGSPTQVKYVPVRNGAGGVLHWFATVSYTNGTGWLKIDPAEGLNNGTIRVDAFTALAPGTYMATLTVDAGPIAGARSIPITLTILPAPATTSQLPVPAIQRVVNSASFAEVPVVPGSLTSIMGSAFSGKNVTVAFDGTPAKVLFSNDSQINIMAPAELAGKASAQVTVSIDGNASKARSINVAPFAPAIFSGAVLNQDSTVNSADNGASRGSVVQIFATGLSGAGAITGRIHDRVITQPYYAGPAPGLPGVQQVNLVVPEDLPAMSTDVYVCGAAASNADGPVCSVPARITLK